MKTADNYRSLVDLIRSDQLTAAQVQHVLEDNPEFARWYRAQIKSDRQPIPQEPPP